MTSAFRRGTVIFALISSAYGTSTWAQNIYPPSGNVGIGTASPAYPLDVSGNVRVQGTLLGTGSAGSAIDHSSQNLLDDTNSSFETGYSFGSYTGYTTFSRDNTTSAYGSYSLKTVFSAACSGGWGNCTIAGAAVNFQPTNPGKQTATWTFWAKASENTSAFIVDINGACGVAPHGLNLTTNWQKFTASATYTDASCTSQSLYFNQSTAAGHAVSLWLDGIQANWGSIGSNWSPGPVLTESYNLNVPGTGTSYIMGTLGIGTTAPTCSGATAACRLAVAGAISAQEVVVTSTGADYVFDPGYTLTPLEEVGDYIKENHHLPGMPSALEVGEKGLSVGDMQTRLLAKIEELTLHMIAAQERSDRLEHENGDLQERLRRVEEARRLGKIQ